MAEEFRIYFICTAKSSTFLDGGGFQDLFYLYCKIPDILGRRRNSGSISFAIQIPDIFELEEFRICFILKQSCQFASYQSRQVQTCLKQSCQFVSYKTRQVQSQPWLAGVGWLNWAWLHWVLGRFRTFWDVLRCIASLFPRQVQTHLKQSCQFASYKTRQVCKNS